MGGWDYSEAYKEDGIQNSFAKTNDGDKGEQKGLWSRAKQTRKRRATKTNQRVSPPQDIMLGVAKIEAFRSMKPRH